MDVSNIYVFGHRNPDTDAICSAIAYANLLQKQGQPARAARCGNINPRTEFILRKAGVAAPELHTDVRPIAGHLPKHIPVVAKMGDPFFRVYERMQKETLRTVPVTSECGRLVGLVPLLNLLDMLFPDANEATDSRRVVHSTLQNIREVLGGRFGHRIDVDRTESLTMMVGAMQAKGFRERLHQHDPRSLVLVSGDRKSIHKPAIEFGIRALIVNGGFKLEPDLMKLAKANGVCVLYTKHDTAMTTLLAKTAKIIDQAVVTDFLSFSEETLLDSVHHQVRESHQDLFPVVDSRGNLINVFSRGDLMHPPAQRIVLVDHNELSQAVPGAEKAEILEVIDHHRLGGGLRSAQPIRFINEPVGSTCTIVALRYQQSGITPDTGIAVCLASGIVADTLLLSSPTTTQIDRDVLDWLEPMLPCTAATLAEEFFATGSALLTLNSDESVILDCKEYTENGWAVTISQVEELGWDQFWGRADELEAALERLRKDHGAAFSCLLVTDVSKRDSLLLVVGSDEIIRRIGYRRERANLFRLPDVVSRKKQFLPHIVSVLRQRPPDEVS